MVVAIFLCCWLLSLSNLDFYLGYVITYMLGLSYLKCSGNGHVLVHEMCFFRDWMNSAREAPDSPCFLCNFKNSPRAFLSLEKSEILVCCRSMC